MKSNITFFVRYLALKDNHKRKKDHFLACFFAMVFPFSNKTDTSKQKTNDKITGQESEKLSLFK